jgi:large subunit ribosomal protein L15
MPYKRGFTNPFRIEYEVVNLDKLVELDLSGEINPAALHEAGVVRSSTDLVKILGSGEISTAMHIRAHKFSASAKEKIEAAGGTAEVIE